MNAAALPWIETIVVTTPVHRMRVWPQWVLMYDAALSGTSGTPFQLWRCAVDLKDDFHDAAKTEFGAALLQIVRIGQNPAIEFTK